MCLIHNGSVPAKSFLIIPLVNLISLSSFSTALVGKDCPACDYSYEKLARKFALNYHS